MFTIRAMQITEAESVLALWQESCIEAVGHPLNAANTQQVLTNLRQYPQHPQCGSLVAVIDEQIMGFVTYSLLNHPVQPGWLGEVEELYVRPPHDRQMIGAALVRQAVIQLKQLGAKMIRTQVGTDELEQFAFWQGLHWDQDTVNFAIYSDVPGDPDLQAVWDHTVL